MPHPFPNKSGSSENARIRRHALRAGVVMLGLLAGGTAGYMMIEGWNLLDALYMSLITLSTIGYGETHPLGDTGRIFTMGLILVGVGNIAYSLGAMTEFFAAGGVFAYRKRAMMERTLSTLSGHTIICGYGRVGSAVAEPLIAAGRNILIIERNGPIMAKLQEQFKIPYVQGDAAADEVLIAAGIERAQALVAALSDDASNVFLVLTARVLNPNLVIYGKAEDPHSLIKLERAGATHRFSPSTVAGHRIALQIMEPSITDIVGLETTRGEYELAVEEVSAKQTGLDTPLPLKQTKFWHHPEVMILAVKTADGTVVFPPHGEHILHPADRVVLMAKAHILAQHGVHTRRH